MSSPNFEAALTTYDLALTTLEKSASPSAEEVLAVLMGRDRAQRELDVESAAPSLVQLIQLDSRLRKQGDRILKAIDIEAYRISLKPPESFWWWYFEPSMHQLDRFDWVWQAITLILLTPSVSLLVEVSSKFLTTVPDTFGALTIVGQSALTVLTGGSLTDRGRKIIQHILTSLRIPRYLWREAQAFLSLILLVTLLGFRLSLPIVARNYMEKANTQRSNGQFTAAETNYKRALNLWPQMVLCNTRLGSLYEDLGELKMAMEQYRLAVQGGEAVAFNNLARLHNLEKNYTEAFRILWTGLQQQTIIEEIQANPQIQVAWYKNMGWARYGQQRYAEANAYLTQAITLANTLDQAVEKPSPQPANPENTTQTSNALFSANDNLGSAYCLQAQVYTAMQQTSDINSAWERCMQYANPSLPEVDQWVGLAQNYARSQSGSDSNRTDSQGER